MDWEDVVYYIVSPNLFLFILEAVGPAFDESQFKGKGKIPDLGVRTDFANQNIVRIGSFRFMIA